MHGLSQAQRSILDPALVIAPLVARKCLQRETADTMESWPLDRSGFSGFSAFVGSPINQPADRPRLERVLRYIFRPSLPLKHLSCRAPEILQARWVVPAIPSRDRAACL